MRVRVCGGGGRQGGGDWERDGESKGCEIAYVCVRVCVCVDEGEGLGQSEIYVMLY